MPAAYAELHCRSNFSFLEGVAHPEQLAEQASTLGLHALALTDRNGFYGVVRFAEAARALSLPTVFGAELSCPEGDLVVLARGPRGYARLSSAISEGQLAGAKGAPSFSVDGLAGQGRGDWWVLTGAS
jgi:error-prone DNA polymerase